MVSRVVLLLCTALLLQHADAHQRLRDPASHWLPNKSSENSSNNGYKYSEEFLAGVPIDHFSFATNKTFELRYFLNVDHFQCGKPIFFYTGNEGYLEGFAQNTGLMWDLAPEFEAAVVFAEHRFYGKTQPMGNLSYSTVYHLGYLSSEQALADFAFLIEHLRTKRIKCSFHSPVIAFGGSYGGMLSAWMRVKYPHLVRGAIASSAPVFWFQDSGVPEDIYDRIVTRTFTAAGCDAKAIHQGWTALQNLAKNESGRAFLNKRFKLEEKSQLKEPKDADFLVAFIKEIFESMAMVDYPYPTSFLTPLPGWPVKTACTFFAKPACCDWEAAANFYKFANLFYNYTGDKATLCANPAVCSGAFAALGNPLGWPWQSCTEMVMPLCAKGPPSDFFLPSCPFTLEGALKYCTETFGKIGYTSGLMRPKWVTRNYGTYCFPSATNIIFSNGYLDPWSGGGFSMKDFEKNTIVSTIIRKGAHHYDLRGANPKDTEEIKQVRLMEKKKIRVWVTEHYKEVKDAARLLHRKLQKLDMSRKDQNIEYF